MSPDYKKLNQLSLINRATLLCNMQWHGWPPKSTPTLPLHVNIIILSS